MMAITTNSSISVKPPRPEPVEGRLRARPAGELVRTRSMSTLLKKQQKSSRNPEENNPQGRICKGDNSLVPGFTDTRSSVVPGCA
jgi:hypothetical protein